jgi:hypothetical protein
MLKRISIALAFTFAGAAANADRKFPELQPGTKMYNLAVKRMGEARNSTSTERYSEFGLINGSGEFDLVNHGNAPNNAALIFQWNGKYYIVDLQYVEVSNVYEVTYDENGVPGLYLKVQGMRISSDTDMPEHVVSLVRFARSDGSPLPALNCHDLVTPGVTPDYHWFYPYLNPRALLAGAAHSRRELTESSFPAAVPGTRQYDEIKYYLAKGAERGSSYLYYTYAFRNLSGEMVGIADANGQHMDVKAGGKYFEFPMAYYWMENLALFVREKTGSNRGIFLMQRGFRHNSVSNALEEVTTKVRVADLDGTVPSDLTFEETTVPAGSNLRTLIFERAW